MSEIPAETISRQDLYAWFKLKAEIAKLRQEEHFLRLRIVRVLYPTPKEGTNNFDMGLIDPLSEGFVLKFTNGIARKVDPALLSNIKPALAEMGVSADKLVRYKPELETKAYRTLTAEQMAFFNQCLDIKPESPQLEVVPTADKKRELDAAKAAATASEPGVDIPVFTAGATR